jgi:hypothetical protein
MTSKSSEARIIMDNQTHLYRLSQPLLDAHHKGMSAADAARELGLRLFNSSTTGLDVMVMMLDDSAKARLGEHEQVGIRDIPVDDLIAELVYRVFSRWHRLGLCSDSYQIFMVAKDFIDARSSMIDAYRAHRGVTTLKALNISAMQCLDASDAIYQRAIYLSRAWFNTLNLRSARITELVMPSQAAGVEGILRIDTAAASPAPDTRRQALSDFDDRELGARVMHALRRNRLATYDPTYPVDGARSIYVLIPLLISYLTHPNAEMEQRMPGQVADLKASLAESALQMRSVNNRYERLRAQVIRS